MVKLIQVVFQSGSCCGMKQGGGGIKCDHGKTKNRITYNMPGGSVDSTKHDQNSHARCGEQHSGSMRKGVEDFLPAAVSFVGVVHGQIIPLWSSNGKNQESLLNPDNEWARPVPKAG